jgi:hypothetical protein
VEPVTVKLPKDVAATPIGVKFPEGKSSGFVTVLCADTADVVRSAGELGRKTATTLPVPSAFSGRFEKAGVEHYLKLEAKKGQKLAIRGQTRSLGSPCDLVLRLSKMDGARVAESKSVGADDGTLDVTVPEDGTYLLSAGELNHRGGAGMVYRLQVERVVPGFTLSVETEKADATAGGSFKLKVKCVRRDYDGPIALSLGGDLAPFEVSGQTIGAGKAEADLEVKVPVDAPTASLLNFTVIGTAKIGDGEFTSVASTQTALKRIFPRMLYLPPELDGVIGLAIKK